MKTQRMSQWFVKLKGASAIAIISLAFLTASAYARDAIQDKLSEILASLQANGDYILGAYATKANEAGEGKIIVNTTDGKKVYDESGQIQESTDRNGNKTIFENGIPVRVVDASGRLVSQSNIKAQPQDGSKWLVSHDCLGNTERRHMNSQGEMIERVDQQGIAYKNEVLKDGQGKTIGVRETNLQTGGKTTRYFDPKTGDIAAVLGPDGDFVQMRYVKDDKGHKLQSFELNTRTGLVTQKAYDEAGRETVVISPNGEHKTIAYEADAQGHVTATNETIQSTGKDAKQTTRQVRKVFDEANRVLSETDTNGRTIKYQYVLTADKQTSKTIEDETITNESGQKVQFHRVREMGTDGRLKSLIEGPHRTTYTYTVGENGEVTQQRETKYIVSTNQKLYEMTTDKTAQGLPKRSEKWDQFGPEAKRHSITTYTNDEVKGKILETLMVNDLGEVTKTKMDDDGLPVSNDTTQSIGPKMKRHSVTTIVTDRRTKLTVSTESVNDLGERSRVEMDEYGIPVRSENWQVSGPKKKRHTVTQLQTNRETNQTERTVSINDLGDVTTTLLDANGLPVSSESQEVLGPTAGRHKVSKIESDPVTGLTLSMKTTDALRETTATMDKNGLAVSTENRDVLGPRLKRHSVSQLTNDENTGLAKLSLMTNDLGDKISTTMDGNGFAITSETWNTLGATLKRHSRATISTNQDTGLSESTVMTNDLGDVTTTRMDGNGLAITSESKNKLGVILKRHSQTTIVSDQATGLSLSTDTIDDLGDRTVSTMDKNGLPVSSESWNVLGATLKRHSKTTITSNQDTGMTSLTSTLNDLGDRTETTMDDNGLAVKSESWTVLGPVLKRHSVTAIKTNQATGMTDSTDSTDDLGDRTLTTMDENGLAVKSEAWNSLGATLKRHSVSGISTNASTGMPQATKNINDLGDVTITQMDVQGMAIRSESRCVLGARKKRNSTTAITCNPETGVTQFTKSRNELGEVTEETKDKNGFTVSGITRGVLGPLKKRDSSRIVETDQQTGMPLYAKSTNTLGDVSETWMDRDGLAVKSHSLDVLGPVGGREKWGVITNRPDTGMSSSTDSFDALHVGPSTTLMDENGLPYANLSVARYGATRGAEKRTDMFTDLDTGITRSSMTYDGLHKGPVVSLMDENGMAVSSQGTDLLGATAGAFKTSRMVNDQDTGMTIATYTQDGLHEGEVESLMDENGLAYFSHSFDKYGTLNGREKTSYLSSDVYTGVLRRSEAWDKLHTGPVVTLMNENGLAVSSSGTDRYGAENGRYKETRITTRPDWGTTEKTETFDALHEGPVVSEMDRNGFAVKSHSVDKHGANFGRVKDTDIYTRADIGTTYKTESHDAMHVGAVTTLLDVDGAALSSSGMDKYGPQAGRWKETEIMTRKDTGVTQATYTLDGLHDGAVMTLMDENGLATSSQSLDKYGPFEGREKMTQMSVDPKTGVTRYTVTYDNLHDGATFSEMDENGQVFQTTAKSKHGAAGARFQKTKLTTNPDTGLTQVSESQTLSKEGGVLVSTTRTENDPVFGLPLKSTSDSTWGSWKHKATNFTMDPVTGLTLRSIVTDKGGYSVNMHSEFGVEKSMRYNELGAIKETTTVNTLDRGTGMPASSVATDRKGATTSTFNADGLMSVSVRNNTGAHYVQTETTRVSTFNQYTGSPLLSVSTDAHGSTTKYSDLDGFLEKTVRQEQWGDQSITTYTNDRESGVPMHSISHGENGTTETWFDDAKNGLAQKSQFTAIYGLNSTSENFYNSDLDQVSSRSVDERGNITVNVCNAAGEAVQSFSKSGVTTMDVYNNRAASSSGPGGSTTYAYDGKWLDSTTNVNKKGETTTTYMEHRPNGAARATTTKDGTTNYVNTYNSRGFVTYRTETKGHDSGYSTFNDYGDQQYTKWKGTIKGESADEYGNQFLGGKWESETTYNTGPRGDVLSWTTKSSWSGKQKYGEIGHYEFVCDQGWTEDGACLGGHEEYKQDQAEHSESVGGSDPAKTEYPDAPPETDDWVLSHLSGTLASQVASAGKPSKTIQDFETDATKPDYHSDYQKAVALSLASQGYAEKLKKSYQPMVARIRELLGDFKKNGNLMDLYRISTYASLDAESFRAQFAKAANKAQFIQQTVDAVYYHFNGQHLPGDQLNVEQINGALNLVNRPTTLRGLQDWLEFLASPEDRLAVSKAMLTTDLAADATDQAKATALLALQANVAVLLQNIALKTLGQGIAFDIMQKYVKTTIPTLVNAQDLASRLATNLQLSGTSSVAKAAGETLTGAAAVTAQLNTKALMDENKLTNQVLGASRASDSPGASGAGQTPKGTQKTEPAVQTAAVEKAPSAGGSFGRIAGTYELKLQDQFAQDGDKLTDGQGKQLGNLKPDGGKVVYQYTGKGQVEATAMDAQGKKLGTAKYQNGMLRQVSLANGTQLTVSYEYNQDKSLKGVEIKAVKGEEQRVGKYDENGKLLASLVKDGDRMKLDDKKEKTSDPVADMVSEIDQKHKDNRLDDKKLMNIQVPQQ